MISAQDLTRTRICAGASCPEDAEHGSELCWRCVVKPSVCLHEAPEVYTGPTLRCNSHPRFFPEESEFFPDEAFNHHNGKAERRGRHPECRRCNSTRKRLERVNWTEEQRERERARHRTPA